MRPRFLADVDLNRAIVGGAKRREPRIDFLGSQTAARDGMEDSEVLTVAARDVACSSRTTSEPCRAIVWISHLDMRVREYS